MVFNSKTRSKCSTSKRLVVRRRHSEFAVGMQDTRISILLNQQTFHFQVLGILWRRRAGYERERRRL